MSTKLKKYISFALLFALIGMLSSSLLFTSCNKNESNGIGGATVLYSYGPMPIARGAELRFIGVNLDKVTAITLPGGIEIPATSFVTKTSTLVTITVPQNAVPGFVVVKSPDGDITTKTKMGFSEPISIAAFSPLLIKTDSILTITGDYLNLVKQVIFTDRIVADTTAFISQTRSQLKVKVPSAAQSGIISVSNGKENPIIVSSIAILNVKLPVITTFLPNPVKAGGNLTITGTNLDLVKSVALGGSQTVTSFVSQTVTQLVLKVPNNTQDDTIRIIPASGVKVKSLTKLVLVAPTITASPTSAKNGGKITITGTDLDLVTSATFAGNLAGILSNQSAVSMDVAVPLGATNGTVVLGTNSGKTVTSAAITFVKPTITTIAPLSLTAGDMITITGTDLDLVRKVTFGGGLTVSITPVSATSFAIAVPTAAISGTITLETSNLTQVLSTASLVVAAANKPVITGIAPMIIKPGNLLTLTGTKLHLVEAIYFQTGVKAISYGVRTATTIEVYVPSTAKPGAVTLTLNAFDGATVISPVFTVSGADPITAQTIIVMDYEQHGGHNGSWDGGWSGSTSVVTENGNTFIKSTGVIGSGWFMNCNHQGNGAPGPIINNIQNYVLKLDVRVDAGVTGAENAAMQFVLGDNWKWFGTGVFPASTSGEWTTVTVQVSSLGLSGTLNLSSGTNGLFGGPIPAGISVDNLRFDPK